MVIYIIFSALLILSIYLAVWTYFPAMFGLYTLMMVYLPIGLFLLLCILKKQPFKRTISVILVYLVLFGFTKMYNNYRFDQLCASYLDQNTEFNHAARQILPDLDSFDNALEVAHYHGHHFISEWIAVKIRTDPNEFDPFVETLYQRYRFYPEGAIYDAPFCFTENPFLLNGYWFRTIALDPDINQYGAAVGVNEKRCEVIIIFAITDNFSYMGLDGSLNMLLYDTEWFIVAEE